MTNPDLFESAAEDRGGGPLAARMRPQRSTNWSAKSICWRSLTVAPLGEGDDRAVSLILYGPPGTGKTTLAIWSAMRLDVALWSCRQ